MEPGNQFQTLEPERGIGFRQEIMTIFQASGGGYFYHTRYQSFRERLQKQNSPKFSKQWGVDGKEFDRNLIGTKGF
jgi:hypothetical protein